jgi:hypothetical protein
VIKNVFYHSEENMEDKRRALKNLCIATSCLEVMLCNNELDSKLLRDALCALYLAKCEVRRLTE